MAILQTSLIQNRQGLQTDLPALAGGEFGWSIDTRRLFIGNGSLADGAPVVGVTEVLTEFSNVSSLLTRTLNSINGSYVTTGGQSATLVDNTSTADLVTTTTGQTISFNYNDVPSFKLEYSLTRGNTAQAGTFRAVVAANGNVAFDDNHINVGNSGISLSAVTSGNLVELKYTSTSTGDDALLKFIVSRFE